MMDEYEAKIAKSISETLEKAGHKLRFSDSDNISVEDIDGYPVAVQLCPDFRNHGKDLRVIVWAGYIPGCKEIGFDETKPGVMAKMLKTAELRVEQLKKNGYVPKA